MNVGKKEAVVAWNGSPHTFGFASGDTPRKIPSQQPGPPTSQQHLANLNVRLEPATMRNPVVTAISTRKPRDTEWSANKEFSVGLIFICKLELEVG